MWHGGATTSLKHKTFRASEEVETVLDALEIKLERTRGDIIRRAILEYGKKNGVKVPA